ncbi:MAG: DNA-binding response regulator [Lysobacterales bacterium CG17_big_fil_post_rev_8_21_14_2_50_64_11]|nr:MAG: DNA-binding response regulator [Xanthomonadales bacterium CG17_big_fil_post_rev_8_21_14_2_50_64_11]PIX60614.1 MAG: DNA-binding response regulator [Xanthomonadales bacterium CG_4_10_14_3_um_filter_64_11]
MTDILIADDHPLFRAALRQAVAGTLVDARVTEAGNLAEALAVLASRPETDLVLLDLHMPGNHGLAGLAAVRAQYPTVGVVVVSANDDPQVIRRALDHGALGFIPKSAGLETLRDAIACVLSGQPWLPSALREVVTRTRSQQRDTELAARLSRLTAQQFRVLALVADGLLNKQIADRLAIQERTVKAHLSVIFEKLGVRNRTQAGVVLRELSLTDPASRSQP